MIRQAAIRQAATTAPRQAFVTAAAVAVGAVAVLQAPPVAPHLTAVADTAVELISTASPAEWGPTDMDALIGQQQLPEAVDVASLDPAALSPSAFDDPTSTLGEWASQAADPAAWVPLPADDGLVGGLFNIVEDIAQFVWNVLTFPLRVVEQVISDVVGLF